VIMSIGASGKVENSEAQIKKMKTGRLMDYASNSRVSDHCRLIALLEFVKRTTSLNNVSN